MPLPLRTARRWAPALLATALLTGCSGGGPAATPAAPATATGLAAAPGTSTGPQGDLPPERLSALLLQTADLPELPGRREYTSPALTTVSTPQLALCSAGAPNAPHELANVLLQSPVTGRVRVFQAVSVFADEAAAAAAHAATRAVAGSCASYSAQGTDYRVEDLADVDLGPGVAAYHYRLTTPQVTGGDVRTLFQTGRYTVLISGYGAPPGGEPLLDYQAAVAAKALARLR